MTTSCSVLWVLLCLQNGRKGLHSWRGEGSASGRVQVPPVLSIQSGEGDLSSDTKPSACPRSCRTDVPESDRDATPRIWPAVPGQRGSSWRTSVHGIRPAPPRLAGLRAPTSGGCYQASFASSHATPPLGAQRSRILGLQGSGDRELRALSRGLPGARAHKSPISWKPV